MILETGVVCVCKWEMVGWSNLSAQQSKGWIKIGMNKVIEEHMHLLIPTKPKAPASDTTRLMFLPVDSTTSNNMPMSMVLDPLM
ncbi:hypothetical protein AAZX31_12G063300 [Glycine max]